MLIFTFRCFARSKLLPSEKIRNKSRSHFYVLSSKVPLPITHVLMKSYQTQLDSRNGFQRCRVDSVQQTKCLRRATFLDKTFIICIYMLYVIHKTLLLIKWKRSSNLASSQFYNDNKKKRVQIFRPLKVFYYTVYSEWLLAYGNIIRKITIF